TAADTDLPSSTWKFQFEYLPWIIQRSIRSAKFHKKSSRHRLTVLAPICPSSINCSAGSSVHQLEYSSDGWSAAAGDTITAVIPPTLPSSEGTLLLISKS